MARRKNRKSRQTAEKKPSENPVQALEVVAPVNENESSGKKQAKNKQESPAQKSLKSGISVTTCLAGMFLSLILGLYLGTLFPQTINKMDAQKQPLPPGEITADKPEEKQVKTSAIPANLAKSIEELESEVKQNPDSAKGWASLGDLYFDTGQIEKSIHAYEHSLEINANNPDVLTDLGIMYRELHQFDKAVECFRQAVKIDPHHTNALFNEGVVCAYDLQDKAAAIAAWKKLLELNPDARTPAGVSVAKMIEELQ